MNLTWHIVKKDLRALRWPIGVWILCIFAKLGVGVLLLNASGQEGVEWFRQMDMMAKGLAVGEVLSFVLVAALIQEDLMVGTTAFWMTRPISGGRLLRAKLLTIGLVFLLAPVVVTLPWWLGCHYGLDEIAWAAAETFAVHAIVVLAALLWSAVTDGLGRFVMWSLVTLVVTPMVTAILNYYIQRKNVIQVPEITSTRLLVAAAVLLLGTGVVLVHQYLTRRTWRSFTLIGATVGLMTLILAFWPWAWNFESRTFGYLIRRAQGEWPATAEPVGLKFSLASAEFTARKERPTRPGILLTKYRVEGLVDAQGLMGYPSEHNWQWVDGTSDRGYTLARSSLNERARQRADAYVKGEVPTTQDSDEVAATSIVPSSTLEKIRTNPAAYSLKARFRLMEFESITPVPMHAGDRQMNGPAGERVAAIEKVGDQLQVTFVRHLPSLWVTLVGGGQLAPSGKFSRYFLANRKNGWLDAGGTLSGQSTRIGTVEIAWQTMFFHASPKAGGRPTLEAINALNDAELIKVTYREQARFTHELRVDASRVAQANP